MSLDMYTIDRIAEEAAAVILAQDPKAEDYYDKVLDVIVAAVALGADKAASKAVEEQRCWMVDRLIRNRCEN